MIFQEHVVPRGLKKC